jgi:hypothetical protein
MSDKYFKPSLCNICNELNYDEFSGKFFWKVNRNRVYAGKIAGTIDKKGYRRIRYFGDSYFAHQLAWFFAFGKFSDKQIDHINGNRDDNSIVNLREATCYENSQNQRIKEIHKTGYMGVIKKGSKFESYITINGKRTFLGLFCDPFDAHIAYKNAKIKHHKFFNENRRIKL